MKTKRCTKCNQCFPETVEFFYRDGRKPSSFRSICKRCYSNHYYFNNRKAILAHIKRRQTIPEVRSRKRITDARYNKSEKGKITQRRANKVRYKKNKLSLCFVAAMRASLSGGKGGRHWESLVDYSLNDLKRHLENLFEPDMSWNNYRKGGWNIDHKIPISSFNITSHYCGDF